MYIYIFNLFFYKIFIIYVLLCFNVFYTPFSNFNPKFHIFNFAKCITTHSRPNQILLDILNKPSLTHNFLHKYSIFPSFPLNRRNYISFKDYKRIYSFVPYNISNSQNKFSSLSFNKIDLRPIESDKYSSEISYNRNSLSRVHLFKSIKNWFLDEVIGWYVPPLPTGQRTSYILKKKGPLLSDEERDRFLEAIGANEKDSIYTVLGKYRTFVKNRPFASVNTLESTFAEFLRRVFVENLEDMELAASYGMKDEEDGCDESGVSNLDKKFLKWINPAEEAEKHLIDLAKHKRRYFGINTRKFRGLIRITKDFKGRLSKCSTTMLPIMLIGLVPKFGTLSIGASNICACIIIYGDKKTDRTYLLDKEEYLVKSEYDRSETVKSLATLFVVGVHTIIGYLISTLTRIGSILSSDTINAFFINLQLTLCSLIYDTSEMTYEEKVKLSNGRLGTEFTES
ncbi:uncharacterized protein TA12955 [Theileria annulata]|uniref:Uncharacterized protein n=1 Tax=Theileria annulata TaxID=5874 RepID=Q4UEA1_THEAN|nr:uncharacterized protein TA12955 [Theileria annulata]CAI74588.1 hypothetical protein TA12955 [Theileria annulata]|eukprot:XP_952320.1 hypothetical protein TA12955 [Theileria annulata]